MIDPKKSKPTPAPAEEPSEPVRETPRPETDEEREHRETLEQLGLC